jgi:inactive STAND
MSTLDHLKRLQREQNNLQETYDLMFEQLSALRQSFAVEMNPGIRIQLKYSIKNAENECSEIETQLSRIEQAIEAFKHARAGDPLYLALLRLNYHAQEELFRQLMYRSQIGAFVIHGEPGYGQNWLLNRLLRLVPRSGVGKPPIPINLESVVSTCDLDGLRQQFCLREDLKNTHSLHEVIDQIHNWWQTQTVVLIFYNFHKMGLEEMREFNRTFWLPLVNKAAQAPCQSPHYKLVIFLVDKRGHIDTWPFDVTEQIDDSWMPHVLVKPPKLSPIMNDELLRWISGEKHTFSIQIQVDDILKNNTDGIPEKVLEKVCELYGCDWFEKEHLWIQY